MLSATLLFVCNHRLAWDWRGTRGSGRESPLAVCTEHLAMSLSILRPSAASGSNCVLQFWVKAHEWWPKAPDLQRVVLSTPCHHVWLSQIPQRGCECLKQVKWACREELQISTKSALETFYSTDPLSKGNRIHGKVEGNLIVYLEVWKEMGQWFVSMVTIIEIRQTDTNSDLFSYSNPFKRSL